MITNNVVYLQRICLCSRPIAASAEFFTAKTTFSLCVVKTAMNN